MDRIANREKGPYCDEQHSLGVPKQHNLKNKGKYFGDVSYQSLKKENVRNSIESRKTINDRLNNERIKALEALQKSQKGEVFKKPQSVNNKEKSKSAINVSSNNPSIQLNHSDYVPFRRPNAINISDLVTDETINLESSLSSSPSISKDVKVSFEPTEITGRSTLYNISVTDILASSFAPKARNLRESLQSSHTTLNSHERNMHGRASSTSSFTTHNASKSLPRTADMSLSKSTSTEKSFGGVFASFSFSSAGAGLSETENFAPGELMQSRLINDEISWAQERAAIPTAALSKQAKAKVMRNSDPISNEFDFPSNSNSIIAGDPNFSVGQFFSMRSENIGNIMKSTSADNSHTPAALVDEDNTLTQSLGKEVSSKISLTPKIDNKTYTRLGNFSTEKTLPRTSVHLHQESKDSGYSKESSYLLSISAIDRALCNLDIQSNSSAIGVSEQLLIEMKKCKSTTNVYPQSNKSETLEQKSDKKMAEKEMFSENKENLDPKNKSISGGLGLCDTMSLSESFLNSSEMKNVRHSTGHSRSPLSPIDVNGPIVQINHVTDDGEEADNDEWPSTPITSNKRIRRTKSPRDKSPLQTNVPKNDSINDITPVNARPSRTYTLNSKNGSEKDPKSMCSTRLDGEDRSTNICDFAISPNISGSIKHCNSSVVVRSNTLYVPQVISPNTASPTRLDVSPMSSPQSYHLSQVPSPTTTSIEFQSPKLDASSNSDHQLLSTGAVRKVVSSPVASESSSTCSYRTMRSYRSAVSGAGGRSVSRCSSSSEFSHRDGKQIPLKVTNTEICWGSIKLRSDSKKTMQIKNTSNKRLVIRIEVSGPGFQIVNSQRSNTLTLHSQECRTICICFCPTVCGVAIGKLSFYAPMGTPTMNTSFLDVPLNGYGGSATIVPQNIFIGPVGSPFVTMGDVCELAQPLERTIRFYNKGPLLGFAAVTLDSIGLLMPRLGDAFEINPRRILIPAENVADVRIVFRPKREEIKKIIRKMGNVLTLANLRVICGDEANRQRICHLFSRMNEEERSKLSSTALDLLWSKFPGQTEVPELNSIKENPSVALDLASYCRIHEILLTINHDNTDDTFEASMFLADVDETVLFRTVCAVVDSPTPSSNLGTINEDEETNNNRRVSKCPKPASWSVTPQSVDINTKNRASGTLYVHNGFKSRQFFEVVCNVKEMFHFTPCDGYLAPDGGEALINIELHANFQYPSESVYITVYMENERIKVPVNIIE